MYKDNLSTLMCHQLFSIGNEYSCLKLYARCLTVHVNVASGVKLENNTKKSLLNKQIFYTRRNNIRKDLSRTRTL